MTIVGNNPDAVIGGVDTHVDVHVAAAVNHVGGVLGVESFSTTRAEYRRLVGWLRSHGELILVGVEGTGSYGVGLSRYLTRAGVPVVEVDRPNRQVRHRQGKFRPGGCSCGGSSCPVGNRYRVTEKSGRQRGSNPGVDDRPPFRGSYSYRNPQPVAAYGFHCHSEDSGQVHWADGDLTSQQSVESSTPPG